MIIAMNKKTQKLEMHGDNVVVYTYFRKEYKIIKMSEQLKEDIAILSEDKK